MKKLMILAVVATLA